MTANLSIVSPAPAKPTVAERIQRLQAEIAALGAEQIDGMRAQVNDAIEAAREVVANPSIPTGVQQLAAQVIRDGEALIQTLDAIRARAS